MLPPALPRTVKFFVFPAFFAVNSTPCGGIANKPRGFLGFTSRFIRLSVECDRFYCCTAFLFLGERASAVMKGGSFLSESLPLVSDRSSVDRNPV